MKHEGKKLLDIISVKKEKIVQLFDCKTEYLVYHKDAELIQKNITGTKELSQLFIDNFINYKRISISKGMIPSIISEILTKHLLEIEIWEQEGNFFFLKKHASPGNISELDDILEETNQTQTVASLFIQITENNEMNINLAISDVSLKKISYSSFNETEYFSTLECVLLQCSVKECLLLKENIMEVFENMKKNKTKFFQIFERCEIYLKNIYNFPLKNLDLLQSKIQEKDLKPILKDNNILNVLFLLLNNVEHSSEQKCFLKKYDTCLFMKIDSSTLYGLNILPKTKEKNKESLFWIMNKCKSRQGERLLLKCIKQPLLNIDDLNKRYDLLEAFLEKNYLREEISEFVLKPLPDLSKLFSRIKTENGKIQDVIVLYDGVKLMKKLLDLLSEKEVPSILKTCFRNPLLEQKEQLDYFSDLVETNVDLNQTKNHVYVLKTDTKENYYKEFELIERKIKNSVERTKEELEISSDKDLKLEYTPTTGYVMRLPRKLSGLVESSEYIKTAVLKNGIHVKTKELNNLSNEYTLLCIEREKKQKNEKKKLLKQVKEFSYLFEFLGELSANIDVLVSLALFSLSIGEKFVRPILHEKSEIILKDSRHPLVEAQGISFISNDVSLTKERLFHIVTGPNTGGKSTYIKQVGICVFLAQIGCFVPCQYAKMSIVDGIFSRVGANDNQFKGMSTFMVEMTEMAAIVNNATKNSLLIIDELGRGTSISDGYGLSRAISKYIVTKIGCFCFFATHFHELTELETEFNSIASVSVSVCIENDSFIPTYKIKEGSCDKSFGVQVAEIAGFPSLLLDISKIKRSELEENTSFSIGRNDANLLALKIKKEFDETGEISKNTKKEMILFKKEVLKTVSN